MEMPGRRSNYTLLSQYPDDNFAGGPYDSPESGDGKINRGKLERGFDWDLGGADHRMSNPQVSRIGNVYSSIGLQRQSSGSSFGESSLSGEYYAPTISTAPAVGNEIDALGFVQGDDVFRAGGGRVSVDSAAVVGGSSGKSWAQQTEESYQLQLALALRLSSEAACADDPNFLDPVPDETVLRSSSSSAEAVSHRFWVCVITFDMHV